MSKPSSTNYSNAYKYKLYQYISVLWCLWRRGSPLPIPNREVKPDSADGTTVTCGRVCRCQSSKSPLVSRGLFFCPSRTKRTSLVFVVRAVYAPNHRPRQKTSCRSLLHLRSGSLRQHHQQLLLSKSQHCPVFHNSIPQSPPLNCPSLNSRTCLALALALALALV